MLLEEIRDIDGILGTGQALDVSTLSLGVHTITVTAIDSDSMSGQDSITFEIGERPTGAAPGTCCGRRWG